MKEALWACVLWENLERQVIAERAATMRGELATLKALWPAVPLEVVEVSGYDSPDGRKIVARTTLPRPLSTGVPSSGATIWR